LVVIVCLHGWGWHLRHLLLLLRLVWIRLILHQFFQGNLIDLHVLLYHHLLEGQEVVHWQDLLGDALVSRVGVTLLAGWEELLPCDAHLSNQLTQQVIHYPCEFLVNGSILKLILLLVVKDETVLFYVADNWRLPSWAFQEGYQTVEYPIIFSLLVLLGD
jgi:hypothetical protein